MTGLYKDYFIYFKIFILITLFSSSISAAELGDIFKRDNGTVIYTTKTLAEKRCEKQGLRLPTFRDYAEYAISFGAKIRESGHKGVNSNDPKVAPEIIQNMQDGFELQTARLSENGRDVIDYYYSNKGYTRPAEEMEESCFWTTTPALDFGSWSFSVFCNRDGKKSTASQNASLAVRCIQ